MSHTLPDGKQQSKLNSRVPKLIANSDNAWTMQQFCMATYIMAA